MMKYLIFIPTTLLSFNVALGFFENIQYAVDSVDNDLQKGVTKKEEKDQKKANILKDIQADPTKAEDFATQFDDFTTENANQIESAKDQYIDENANKVDDAHAIQWFYKNYDYTHQSTITRVEDYAKDNANPTPTQSQIDEINNFETTHATGIDSYQTYKIKHPGPINRLQDDYSNYVTVHASQIDEINSIEAKHADGINCLNDKAENDYDWNHYGFTINSGCTMPIVEKKDNAKDNIKNDMEDVKVEIQTDRKKPIQDDAHELHDMNQP